MARILLRDEWYEQIAPRSLYETEYERLILQHASKLYPSFVAIPFKKTVYSDDNSAKPDLVLVEKKYRSWWVVEVEMGDHSLEGHVLPQVITLANARYDSEVANYVADQSDQLDVVAVSDMIKGKPPEVLVVVNELRYDWVEPLLRHRANLAFFEVFRSPRDDVMFRVNGFQPSQPADILTECALDPLIPNFLRVESPAALDTPLGGTVTLRHEHTVSEWTRLDVEDAVWLVPVDTNPLLTKLKYCLLRQEDGTLLIRPKE